MTRRVLVNALHAKAGGGVTYLRNVVPKLAEDSGLDLHLAIHEDQRSLLPDGIDAVTVHAFDFEAGFYGLLLREQFIVPRLARQIGAEATLSLANYGPLFAPKPVLVIQNALSVVAIEKRLAKKLYWWGLKAATAASLMTAKKAIAISEYAWEALGPTLAGLFRAKHTVIPLAAADVFHTDDTAREDFLLAVGDVYVQKNYPTLLKALAKVEGVPLKIVARPIDAEHKRTLDTLIETLGLGQRVSFVEHIPPADLASLYRRCRAFVFTSTVETFGIPLLEAMACGAPVISSNAAAMPEVVGDAALTFAPDDVDKLAEHMAAVRGDDALAATLSQASVTRAAAFSWESTAAGTAAVLKSIP